MAKVTIDQEACIACGQCYAVCPDVFQDDGSGTAELVNEFQGSEVFKGEVPDDIDCSRDAEDACPVDAIEVKL
ncbi:MAG: ferredoxin [Candidatus Saliniplasma sp.]